MIRLVLISGLFFALCGQAHAQASICIGAFCQARCADDFNWCWYSRSGTQLAQANPTLPTDTPTPSMSPTITATTHSTPPPSATPTIPGATPTPSATDTLTPTATSTPVAVIVTSGRVALSLEMNGVPWHCSAMTPKSKHWSCSPT
jgi:hypothetical protein